MILYEFLEIVFSYALYKILVVYSELLVIVNFSLYTSREIEVNIIYMYRYRILDGDSVCVCMLNIYLSSPNVLHIYCRILNFITYYVKI